MHKYKSCKNTTVYFLKIFLAMNKPPEKREIEATKHNPSEWYKPMTAAMPRPHLAFSIALSSSLSTRLSWLHSSHHHNPVYSCQLELSKNLREVLNRPSIEAFSGKRCLFPALQPTLRGPASAAPPWRMSETWCSDRRRRGGAALPLQWNLCSTSSSSSGVFVSPW